MKEVSGIKNLRMPRVSPLLLRNLLLALLTAVALILTVPRFDYFWLAPFALAPLLVAVARQPSFLHRAALGWAAGIVYWFGVCYWIQFVLSVHGGMGEAGGWATFLLFCLAKGLHMALFAALAGVIMRTAWAVPTVPALWVALEATHGPLGFAWFALGNAGVNLNLPMRLAPYTGVYGLSFVFAMMSAGVAVVLLRRPRGELLWLLILPLLILLPSLPEPERPQQTVVLVQPNLSMDVEWTSESVERLHRRLVSASLEAAIQAGAPKPALIVWPEVPAPLYFYEDARFRDQVATLTRVARTGLLMGTVARNQDGAPLNSALLLSSAGEPVSRYDKIKLVPFGEFVPWPFDFVNQISDEVGAFSPGREVVVSRMDGHRISTFICYESVFPNLVRRFAAAGAEVLFNISNDGYFGTSAAREQHLKIVRMRAAENGRWIVRATNNGITAAIDPAGRIRAAAPSYRETVERMPFDYRSDLTVYTRYGDWFAWLCALMAGLALYLSREYVT